MKTLKFVWAQLATNARKTPYWGRRRRCKARMRRQSGNDGYLLERKFRDSNGLSLPRMSFDSFVMCAARKSRNDWNMCHSVYVSTERAERRSVDSKLGTHAKAEKFGSHHCVCFVSTALRGRRRSMVLSLEVFSFAPATVRPREASFVDQFWSGYCWQHEESK